MFLGTHDLSIGSELMCRSFKVSGSVGSTYLGVVLNGPVGWRKVTRVFGLRIRRERLFFSVRWSPSPRSLGQYSHGLLGHNYCKKGLAGPQNPWVGCLLACKVPSHPRP